MATRSGRRESYCSLAGITYSQTKLWPALDALSREWGDLAYRVYNDNMIVDKQLQSLTLRRMLSEVESIKTGYHLTYSMRVRLDRILSGG